MSFAAWFVNYTLFPMKIHLTVGIHFLFTVLLLASPLWGQDRLASHWNDHGFSAESRTKLHDYLRNSVENGSVPGGILILVHQGETIFRESFGFRDLKERSPFETTTPFRAASLSKSIISTLAVKLHADGVLDLDDPIDKRLPAAIRLRVGESESLQRMPTIRECLHHTAGFAADESGDGRPWIRFRGRGMTLAEAVDEELNYPLARQPGQQFAYSGIGYDIVGRVIEVATGQLLEEVLQTRLCKPLGMNRTTFHPDQTMQQQLAGFYWRWRSDGRFQRQLDPRIVSAGQYTSVGGGIVTTADDLARFMLMHRNSGVVKGERWIDEDLLKQQYRRKRPGAYYGLGFTLGTGDDDDLGTWILHTGSSGTMFWWGRQTDTIGVIVTQQRYSNGEKMPESQKRIPKTADSWPATLKKDCIDPVFGWRSLIKSNKIIP